MSVTQLDTLDIGLQSVFVLLDCLQIRVSTILVQKVVVMPLKLFDSRTLALQHTS